MKKLFVCFSHSLTQPQKDDFDGEIVVLKDIDADLANKASNVPPEWSEAEIVELAENIVDAAIRENATHFYIAGEPTLVYHAMKGAKEAGMQVIQSTTRRESEDIAQPDGSVKRVSKFKHVQWRELNL